MRSPYSLFSSLPPTRLSPSVCKAVAFTGGILLSFCLSVPLWGDAALTPSVQFPPSACSLSPSKVLCSLSACLCHPCLVSFLVSPYYSPLSLFLSVSHSFSVEVFLSLVLCVCFISLIRFCFVSPDRSVCLHLSECLYLFPDVSVSFSLFLCLCLFQAPSQILSH